MVLISFFKSLPKPVYISQLFVLILLFHVNVSRAESPSFSLVDAYQLAQHNDSTASIFRSEVDAQQERSRQSLAGLLPNLSLRAYGDTRKQDVTQPGFLPYNSDFNSSDLSATVSQPLYRPVELANYRLSKVQSAIAKAQYELTEQDIMYRVAVAYFDVLIAQETLATIKSQSTVITQLYAQAESLYKNGQVWVTDVDEARASYDLAHIQTIRAKSDLEIKKQVLRKYTGRLPARLAVFLGEENLIPLVPEELSEWEKLALENSPHIILAKLELESADEIINVAHSGHYPTVDLIARYAQLTGDLDNETTDIAVGVLLEIPLYSGGVHSAGVREAKASRNKSRYSLHDITEQVLMNVRQSYLLVSNNRLLVQVTKQSFESSQAVLESSHLGVKNQIRNSLDVLNAQLAVFDSQREMVSAAYEFLKSMLGLKIAAGTLTLSDLRVMDRVLVANR